MDNGLFHIDYLIATCIVFQCACIVRSEQVFAAVMEA